MHKGGTVQLGSLEVGVIDAQQRSGVDDDVLALAGKQRHDHQGQHRGLAGAQPVLGGQVEEGEQLVEQAGGRGIVDPQPHHRKRDAGGHGGQVVHCLEHRLQLLFKGHDQDGHSKGDQQRKRYDHHGVDQRVFQRLPEQRVGKGGLVVFQANKIRAEGFVILQAGNDSGDQRVDGKHQEKDDGRPNKRIAPQVIVGKKGFLARLCNRFLCRFGHSGTSCIFH